MDVETFTTVDTVVTNIRHHQELINTHKVLEDGINGIDKGITNDILAMDIRQALHHLGEITGQIPLIPIIRGNILK